MASKRGTQLRNVREKFDNENQWLQRDHWLQYWIDYFKASRRAWRSASKYAAAAAPELVGRLPARNGQ
jgi:hypothetical protein